MFRSAFLKYAIATVAFAVVLIAALGWNVKPSSAAPTSVVIGGSTFTAVGYNEDRGPNQLVIYTSTRPGEPVPTNQWGTEVVVVNSVVTGVHDRLTNGGPPVTIPTDGYVLSGHGDARTWLLAHATFGATVARSSVTEVPPGTTLVSANETSYVLAGTDLERATDQLIRYTSSTAAGFPPNQWGADATVVGGKVAEVRDRQNTGLGPLTIPSGGYALSGHGAARTWLLTNLRVGTPVTTAVSGSGGLPPRAPKCTAGTVRLTFDDGPNPATTPQILKVLRDWGAKATFFVIGEKAALNPELIKAELAEGHKVGNHTWTHPYLTKLTAAQMRSELSRTSAAIKSASGVAPTEWRPPYEDWNKVVRDEATRQGMSMVLWNYETDSNDWQGLTTEKIVANVVQKAKDGSILLMHDMRQNAMDALPGVLDGLNKKGLCAK